jgi:GTP-binding protein
VSLFHQATFVASVGKLAELPAEGPREIAFAGRSNVGKSSAINVLANRKRLAFTSKTPGRTQTINFYGVGECARLVDLPGYGYARVPHSVRLHWDRLVGGYLTNRVSLAGVVVLMDARHPYGPADTHLIEWLLPLLRSRSIRLAILLTKSDKLSRSERRACLDAVSRRLAQADVAAEVRLFSALTREGTDEFQALLETWLDGDAGTGDKRPSPTSRSGSGPKNKKAPGKGD